MLRQGHDPLTVNNRAINESVTHFPFCLLCKRLRDFAVGSNGFAGTAEPENHKSAWRIWWRLANNFFVYFCKQFIAPPEKRDGEISISTYHQHLLISTSLLGRKVKASHCGLVVSAMFIVPISCTMLSCTHWMSLFFLHGRRTFIPLSVLFATKNTPGTHKSSHQVHSTSLMALVGLN